TGGLNVFTAPLVHVGGASIVCRGFAVDQLFDLLEAHPVTCLFGVPTMFIDVQAHPRFPAIPFERLRVLISGGAPCPLPVFERFWARGVDFRSGYGLTEAGPNNFWLPTAELRAKAGAVGYPLMHVEARIVGDAGEACGADEVGELRLRGPHLFAGYWRNPKASAAALDGDGWLRTGDLARADADGCVTIVGRAKDMYISGGENVYPAEIEAVLAGHPDVAEVAIVGAPHPRWGEVGVAFIVRRPGAAIDEAALLDFARARLARYKAPKSARFVDALPRTGAGKVDKRALARGLADG
ncbi:MAG: AMP-binding protein, partial [Myxococcales bacterium]|nr:AMP-binding protein [Myxococcales bacterium]